MIPENAHVRLSSAAANGGAQMLRRGYSYNDGVNFTAERWPPWRQGMEYDAGLFFVSYQSDPLNRLYQNLRKHGKARCAQPIRDSCLEWAFRMSVRSSEGRVHRAEAFRNGLRKAREMTKSGMKRGFMLKAILTVSLIVAATSSVVASEPQSNASQVITIEDHVFHPAEIHFPSHKSVVLLIKNQDSTPEEFECGALQIEKVIPAHGQGYVHVSTPWTMAISPSWANIMRKLPEAY